jgi:hypothetical protein
MGLWKENAVLIIERRRRIARRIYVARDCVLLMKTKVTPRLEADRRSKRNAYRRARKRALARPLHMSKAGSSPGLAPGSE